MYAGVGAKLAVGAQSNWSTIVAATKAISFSRENLAYRPVYKGADLLVGRKGSGRMDIVGSKVEGDFSCMCYPDEIGILLSAVLGAEATQSAVAAGVYDHVMTPMSSVAASSLAKLTITVDRIAEIYGYIGCKLESMRLEARGGDYLRATFGVVGYDETTDTNESLTPSTLVPFHFSHGAFTVGGAAYHVRGASLDYRNNLENDLFTAYAAGGKMAEIEPQGRVLSGTLDVLWDTTSKATRATNFKGGTPLAISLVFTSTEVITGSYYYILTISIPVAYITDAPIGVGGTERPPFSLSFAGTETAAANMITVTLRDGLNAKYIA
jgi:hypothetical protein